MEEVIIVIPIYKEEPLYEELASIKQCLNTLGKYPICFVCPNNLDIKRYKENLGVQMILITFDKVFFSSTKGYNKLLKSHFFYKVFRHYKYLLIYQPDAWVFRDDLIYWCNKGYDYIGAPWLSECSIKENGKPILTTVGNGGLSLRKIDKFLELTKKHKRLRDIKTIFTNEINKKGGVLRCISLSLGWHNTISCLYNSYKDINEDIYFCTIFSEFPNLRLYVPSAEESSFFSFEKSPSYLYELTNHLLPFGCHGWTKYETEFWKGKITFTII
jgi:hypothetical protein